MNSIRIVWPWTTLSLFLVAAAAYATSMFAYFAAGGSMSSEMWFWLFPPWLVAALGATFVVNMFAYIAAINIRDFPSFGYVAVCVTGSAGIGVFSSVVTRVFFP